MICSDPKKDEIYDTERGLILANNGGAYRHYFYKLSKGNLTVGVTAERDVFCDNSSDRGKDGRRKEIIVWNILCPLGGVLGMTEIETRNALIGLLKEYDRADDSDEYRQIKFVFGEKNFLKSKD